jgi:RHS repeat-associated protein
MLSEVSRVTKARRLNARCVKTEFSVAKREGLRVLTIRYSQTWWTNYPFRQTLFAYDGQGRLRVRLELQYTHVPDPGGDDSLLEGGGGGMTWSTNSITRYIYDGWRVIQERDESNEPVVNYTRGTDLSGSLEGAGGIGGLLARSYGYNSGNMLLHVYYHADANGNITYLVSTSQTLAASYRYDPYGNVISSSGGLASVNTYRFSSKMADLKSGQYYFGYRFYEPNFQRWVNSDPLGEAGFELLRGRNPNPGDGGPNLYGYVRNRSVDLIDPFGLDPQDAEDIIKVIPDLIKLARGRFFACWCLASVTATLCRCIKNNLTNRSGMAECLCLTVPDSDCKKKVEQALKDNGL